MFDESNENVKLGTFNFDCFWPFAF